MCSGRGTLSCHCHVMLTDAGREHYVRTVVDEPIYSIPPPSPPPPYRNTEWDRMAWPWRRMTPTTHAGTQNGGVLQP